MWLILYPVLSVLAALAPLQVATVHAQPIQKNGFALVSAESFFNPKNTELVIQVAPEKLTPTPPEEKPVDIPKPVHKPQQASRIIETVDISSLQERAKEMVFATWDNDEEWQAFYQIAMAESGFNPNAINKSSGACGIPQSLPCSKIKDKSPEGQLQWMINYIIDRYQTPRQAWAWWQKHRWY